MIKIFTKISENLNLIISKQIFLNIISKSFLLALPENYSFFHPTSHEWGKGVVYCCYITLWSVLLDARHFWLESRNRSPSFSQTHDYHSYEDLYWLSSQWTTAPFNFSTRGQWIKGKQCQHIAIKNKICVCVQNNLAYFPFMHCPLVLNQKVRWSIGKSAIAAAALSPNEI